MSGAYRMGFELTPDAAGSWRRLFIDYVLPANGIGRRLGRLLGSSYAKWCTRRMVADAARQFASDGISATLRERPTAAPAEIG